MKLPKEFDRLESTLEFLYSKMELLLYGNFAKRGSVISTDRIFKKRIKYLETSNN